MRGEWGCVFGNDTPLLAANLAKLPRGKYPLKWVVESFAFIKFDGDGRPVNRNRRSPKWPGDIESAQDGAKRMETGFRVEWPGREKSSTVVNFIGDISHVPE